MQGAAPLASPGLNPGGTYSPNKKGTRWGACLVCRLPALPLALFLSPIPPTPFPSGEGGDHKFFHARGFAPCIPGLNPGGAYSPNKKGTRRGACLVCRLPALTLVCFVAPIPPPALAERSSPAGRGRDYSFLMQGALPLASPGLNPGGTYSPNKKGTRRGGLPCLPPADHAFSLFSFPHPPDPLPLRGRGRLKFFHARGFAPCIPGAEPGRRWLDLLGIPVR